MGILSTLLGLPSEKNHAAAMNALVAKYILSSEMSEQLNQAVGEQIHTILCRDGNLAPEDATRHIKQMNERVLFSFAALAMMEIGVTPPENVWCWVNVQNPFVALIKAYKEIEIARVGLESRQGIRVSLE
jgi:hypothetical protein